MHVLARKDGPQAHAGTLRGVHSGSTRQRLVLRVLGCSWLPSGDRHNDTPAVAAP